MSLLSEWNERFKCFKWIKSMSEMSVMSVTNHQVNRENGLFWPNEFTKSNQTVNETQIVIQRSLNEQLNKRIVMVFILIWWITTVK
jgi:hypothetical protein